MTEPAAVIASPRYAAQRRTGQALALTALFAVALAIRLPVAAPRYGISTDEAFTWKVITGSRSLGDVIRVTGNDVHPPLYYLLALLWTRSVGVSLAAMRSFSAVLGACTVAATYWYARVFVRGAPGRKGADVIVPLTAAGLTALNLPLVAVSHSARMYPLSSLLAVLCMALLLRARETGSWRDRVAYSACATAALYTHNFALFVVAGQMLWLEGDYLFRRPFDPQGLAGALAMPALVAVGYLPWIPWLLWQSRQVAADYWIPSLEWGTVVALLRQPFDLPIETNIATEGPETVLLLVAVVLLFVPWRRSRPEWQWAVVVLTHVACIILVTASLRRAIFVARYAIPLLPLAITSLAYWIGQIPNRLTRRGVLAWLFLGAVSSLWGAHRFQAHCRSGEQAAVERIVASGSRGVVLIDKPGLYLVVRYYLAGRVPCLYVSPRRAPSAVGHVIHAAAIRPEEHGDLAALSGADGPFWLIDREFPPRWLPDNWQLAEHHEFQSFQPIGFHRVGLHRFRLVASRPLAREADD